GDRLGRKGAFLVTVSLMGAATFLIGFLPTYAQAGTLGPTLLIILRILQGVALGGEYGGAAIYVAEHAPNDKRGASTGWIQSSASFGLLAALLVIVATRTWVGEEAFLEKSLGLPSQIKDLLLIVMTVVSAPLYVYFGWLSDRVGRKPVMVGGMLLALVLYFPASHWIADAANPALIEAQNATPIFVV